jgi:hypothetical protein
MKNLPGTAHAFCPLICVLAATAMVAATACHSYHVDATVENRTGSPIQLLEVDYPSASFGADSAQ